MLSTTKLIWKQHRMKSANRGEKLIWRMKRKGELTTRNYSSRESQTRCWAHPEHPRSVVHAMLGTAKFKMNLYDKCKKFWGSEAHSCRIGSLCADLYRDTYYDWFWRWCTEPRCEKVTCKGNVLVEQYGWITLKEDKVVAEKCTTSLTWQLDWFRLNG